jgi:hypothetical protein
MARFPSLRALGIPPTEVSGLPRLAGGAGDDQPHRLDLTNHTYFFREPQHFDFLSQVTCRVCENPHTREATSQVWSAATFTARSPTRSA